MRKSDNTFQGTEVRYALCPHRGDWERGGVQRLAEEWQEPLIVGRYENLPMEDRSLLRTDNPDIVLTTASVRDGSLVFRLYNASRQRSRATLHLGMPTATMTEEDLLGNTTAWIPMRSERQGCRASVVLPPFGVRTYRVGLTP